MINKKDYDFSTNMEKLQKELRLQNLDVDIHFKDKKTVASAFIKFNTLLHQLNLSPLKDQKLSIKFEVDQNPPSGYHTTFTMINKDFLIGINQFDLPSLFAGKLHALLCRKYTKGRDYYDFMWYLSKKIDPNYLFLNQAILQTENKNLKLDRNKLIVLLTQKINETNFKKIKEDVEPFLEIRAESRFFEKNIFLNLLQNAFTQS